MITSQVVAAHRPPSPPPLPPPPILDFVQAVAARCCLSFPLSCAAVLRICMAHQAASPPIPSRQASALASSAHVPAAARMALAAPCVPLATATHILFGIASAVTGVCMRVHALAAVCRLNGSGHLQPPPTSCLASFICI